MRAMQSTAQNESVVRHRAVNVACQRRRRVDMEAGDVDAARENNAACKRARGDNMTPSERQQYRFRQSAQQRQRRAARRAAIAASLTNGDAMMAEVDVASSVLAATRELLCSPVTPPGDWTPDDTLRAALEYRDAMAAGLLCCLCAVCGRRAPAAECSHLRLLAVPGLYLLRVAGEPTAEFPRIGLTTVMADNGVSYCLNSAGMYVPHRVEPRVDNVLLHTWRVLYSTPQRPL